MTKKKQNERIKALDRRSFIKAGSLLGLGSLLPVSKVLAVEGEAAELEQTNCDSTTDDIQGPFYLPGSPSTTQIAGPNEPGTRLFISGKVFSNDCMTPIANAKIEVWQANDAAVYDNSAALNLRGTLYSDANGNYAYETIKPGPYLNGAQYRPSHIHYKVTKLGYPDLVTQLYFQGDPYIANDPWASATAALARIIPLNTISAGEEGVFDIVLDGTVGIKPNQYGEDGDVRPPYPNPSSGTVSVHFNVFRKANVKVSITDIEGKEVATLVENKGMPQGRYTTQWDGKHSTGTRTNSGVYLIVLQMDGRVIKTQRIIRELGYGY